ncbi:unannotated protein [freshwater metagenome]|uniref:Unannotated protein n=1 Tax=freshwater metagenome TaxID=449393 RepID=A0A6J7CYV7_9ZZZZ|nr:hypothetical protein [Actinomycetota bacterium]
MSTTEYDVIAAEIHRKALENVAREMAITLMRTSGSPIVVEAKDFSTCLLDRTPEHLSFAAYVIAHLGSSLVGTQKVNELAQSMDLAPGDGWIVNDPHTAGALHQGDVSVIMPTFYGDEHLGWSFVNMHVLDIGGVGISGFAPGAHDVWQEGLRFPPIRVIRDGVLSTEWEEFIAANVRVPGPVINDLRSMIAANNTASRKLTKLIDEYGLERHKQFCELNKDLSEKVLRSRIAALPDGVYSAVNWNEYDGHEGADRLLEMRLDMEVAGDDLHFRYSGVPQIDGFVNSTSGSMLGCTMTALTVMLAYGDLPVNGGMFRPIHLDLGEPGTIVNATPPAPVSASHAEVGSHAVNLVRDALNQALVRANEPSLRRRVSGRTVDGFPAFALFGANQHGGSSVMFYVDGAAATGGPAQPFADGLDTYGFTMMAGCGMSDVETHEAQDPVFFLWRRITANCGGPGIARGGNGMEQAYAVRYAAGVAGPVWNNIAEVPPHGFGGGLPPSAGDYIVMRETNVDELLGSGLLPTRARLDGTTPPTRNKVTHLALGAGDVFLSRSGGGGGLGDPLLRELASIGRDLQAGYVTPKHAAAAYGVVVSDDGKVDEQATAERRAAIRRERIGREPARDMAHPEVPGVATVHADGSVACAYCSADLGDPDRWSEGPAVVARTTPVVEAFADWDMRVRDRQERPQVTLAARFCGTCAGALQIETIVEGWTSDAPVGAVGFAQEDEGAT